MVRQSSISCLMSDVRCPMSDVRCPMSDVILYRRFLGVAVVFSEPKATSTTLSYTIPDIGHRTSDIGHQTSDIGHQKKFTRPNRPRLRQGSQAILVHIRNILSCNSVSACGLPRRQADVQYAAGALANNCAWPKPDQCERSDPCWGKPMSYFLWVKSCNRLPSVWDCHSSDEIADLSIG